ncbi:hypothetical protein CHARACLAT_027216 [Characodon lateralis]|uniref:Uncharacterized protein n=1 Tax=Characodon lateralis TaxID=208331 RepID=A0ABU7DB61_9TELE|nr:hypothetical protein [Characodon lateralis]
MIKISLLHALQVEILQNRQCIKYSPFSAVCLYSLHPESKFLFVFVNDKLINNSSTLAAPSGPRFQGDRR